MKNIIIAVLFAWCCNVSAGDLPDLGEPSLGRYELTKGQIAAETAFAALMYVDYRQTMDIRGWCERHSSSWTTDSSIVTSHPDGSFTTSNGEWCHRYEINPLLGKHPSDVRIRNYFVGATLAHVAITKALPSEYRPYWQGAWIITEIALIVKNRKLGLSVNF